MRSISVAKRVIKQIVKDRRTLALLFIAPLLIIFLLFAVLNSDVGKPRAEAVGLPSDLVNALKKEADVKTVDSKNAAMTDLKENRTDAVITFADPDITVTVEGSQPTITAAVKKAAASAVSTYSKKHVESEVKKQVSSKVSTINQNLQAELQKASRPGASIKIPNVKIDTDLNVKFAKVNYSYVYGSDTMTTFDSIAPLMMGFFIFFFVFLIAGVAFLRERTSGTLDRVLATPIKRIEIVFGYFIGFGIFVLLQTLVIQLFMFYCLGIELKGSFLLLLLTNILLASGSLSLGTLLSAFARNELQMFQFIPIVIVPQILLCGLFNLRGAPEWVTVLSKIFPLSYASDAITNIAVRGRGIQSIAADLVILAAYTAAFIVLNSLALKKYRRI
ncbi:MAG TPA: ABC transporter permease [Ruminiclostridium sp.]|nr:ABC transporter permease [Ruminiclostridium sp.]